VDFYCYPKIPKRCPDCDGTGRKPYPSSFYPCHRCEGSGEIVDVVLTYPESLDSGCQPSGRQMFGGIIERPYHRNPCGR